MNKDQVTDSLWDDTHTYFPMLISYLKKYSELKNGLLVGCADGHFVGPLLNHCNVLTVVELDKIALFGGEVQVNKDTRRYDKGVVQKFEDQIKQERLKVVESNILDIDFHNEFDFVFTSSSFHYSINEGKVESIIHKMIDSIKIGGIYSAEYMMPINEEQLTTTRFLKKGEMVSLLEGYGIDVSYSYYSEPYLEKAHAYVPYDHYHQMGFSLGHKCL